MQGFMLNSEVVSQLDRLTLECNWTSGQRLVCYKMAPGGDCGLFTLLLCGGAGWLEVRSGRNEHPHRPMGIRGSVLSSYKMA